MKKLLYILLLLIMTACSANDQFRVNGNIEGKPTMNLRASYYSDGELKTVITAVRDGEFEFFGNAPQPAMLEITDYDFRPLARLYVRNGETYDITADPADFYAVRASGNDVSSRWAEFLRNNSKGLKDKRNAVVAEYIGSHPDDVLSSLLLLTEFDATGKAADADSLMELITPQARPANIMEGYTYMLQRLVLDSATGKVDKIRYIDRGDSAATFATSARPLSVIALSETGEERTDSIVPALKRMHKKYGSRKLAILDITLNGDTMEWKRAIRTDSAAWRQGWAPGGTVAPAVSRLGIPSLPFMVVCDSTGTQLYRGSSAARAEAMIEAVLKDN